MRSVSGGFLFGQIFGIIGKSKSRGEEKMSGSFTVSTLKEKNKKKKEMVEKKME